MDNAKKPARAPAPKKPPAAARTPGARTAGVPAKNAKAQSSNAVARAVAPLRARLPRIDWAHVRERLGKYAQLARMHKPIGAALLLWPTWWALWLAAGDFPPWSTLIIFTFGVFLMRSAGCVVNDYADRKLDPQVKRTRDRPLAAGSVSSREAAGVFVTLIALAFALVLFTNRLTIQLSAIGAILAITYPFSKRYTYLPQVYLGCAFGWSIPMAFAAVKGTDHAAFMASLPLCGLLFLGNVIFSTIYDTEYAMVDRDDDLRIGTKSTAILFGDADLAILGVLMVTFLLTMLLVASRGQLHWPYFVAVVFAGVLFGWQQWVMRARSREGCFSAFSNNNWVGMVIWVGILVSYAVR